MKPDIYTLENGLTVILVDTAAFPSVTTMLLVGAGSRYENLENNGIAHFFEHMAFKGSQKYPDSHTIASTIEGMGGVFNAFTSKDHTGYWIKAPNSQFDTVIDVLSDMVLHPLLLQEEIDREKGVITEEINMYEDTPARQVEYVLEELMYEPHPLGYDIIGMKETVNSVTKEMIQGYIKDFYLPNNSILVVSGGIQNSDTYKNKIEQKFRSWKQSDTMKLNTIQENQKSPKLRIKYKKTEQAHFCLGYRAFSFFDDRKYALNIVSTILGGGMSSRLFREVRERRGLCYYVSTSRESYHDCGSLITQAGVVNKKEKIQEAVKTIREELNKMVEGKIEDSELKRAKETIKGRILLSLESSHAVASFYGTKKLLEGSTKSPEDIITCLEEVTKEACVSVAQDVLRDSLCNFALIGPFQEEDFPDMLS